jgi:ubiquinol-cytochrome c reductase cytochrome b subunit
VSYEALPPAELPPDEDENGVRRKGARKERLRARLSRFYFDDRIEPVTPAELAAAQDHGHGHGEIGSSDHGAAITTGH